MAPHLDSGVANTVALWAKYQPHEPPLTPEHLVADVREVLPCRSCWRRMIPAAPQALAGLRLGKHERHILLTASALASHVAPLGQTPAVIEAHRRALRRLQAAGLVYLGWQEVDGHNDTFLPAHTIHVAGHSFDLDDMVSTVWWHSRRRTVALNSFGLALVRACRPVLQSGARLRWPRLLPAIAAELRRAAALSSLLYDAADRCRVLEQNRDVLYRNRPKPAGGAFYGWLYLAARDAEREARYGTKR